MNTNRSASLHRAVVLLAASLALACDSGVPLGPRLEHVPRFNAQGNSEAARACQEGGYASFTREDGTTFASAGECVSYAARGGTLRPLVEQPFIYGIVYSGLVEESCGTSTTLQRFTATFTGGTGSIAGAGEVFSGVPFTLPWAHYPFTLTVTNSLGVSVSMTFTYTESPVGCW